MERFWKAEEPEASSPQFTVDGLCEELFQTEMSRDSQGRFSVVLPFHSGRSTKCFPGSRQVAVNRLLQLERKLSANQIFYNAYRKFMQEYEKLATCQSLKEMTGITSLTMLFRRLKERCQC